MKSSISSYEAKILKNFLQLFDSISLNYIAKATGFIKRDRKLDVFSFVLLMILEARGVIAESLNSLSIQLLQHGINMSRQGIDFRFNESAVLFMKELSSKIMSLKFEAYTMLHHASNFNRILIKDSTIFQLPSSYSHKYAGPGGTASSSGIKLQYEYDLKGSCNIGLDIQAANKPDSKSALKDIQPMDLCLTDLGYFKLDHFKAIIKQGAYFLSRHKFNTAILIKESGQYKKIDLSWIIAKMRTSEFIWMEVYIGWKEKLPVNLIMERVPQEVSAEKRKKLKKTAKRKGTQISKDRLAFCDVNAYITNVDREFLPITLIRSIYSLRWQIDIVFKTWKSTFNLNKVKPMKIERFECVTYGTLIKIILCSRLYNYYKTTLWNKNRIELSELKSYKYILKVVESLKIYLQHNEEFLIKKLFIDTPKILRQNCLKECKKDKLTPMMILNKIP